MLLQLKPLFLGEKDVVDVDAVLDFSDVEWSGTRPFPHPVSVKGQVSYQAGVATLRATADTVWEGVCDRCAAPVSKPYRQRIEHVLITSAEDGEDEELVLLDQFQLPLDAVVRDDLILRLPSKTLCRPDCKGLCPQCGQDLNQGPCHCCTQTIDPRLEILKNWMNQK